MKSRAVTVVEVLIVVIVLGILAAIVVPQFSRADTDVNLSNLKTNLQIIRGQIQLYKLQHRDTLPAAANFSDQLTKTTNIDGIVGSGPGYDFGPYLQNIPKNPYTSTNTVGTGPAGTSAWYYDAATGAFRANNDAASSSY
jgi:general secretion pathway protein G